MPSIPGIESIELGGVISSIMYWAGYLFLALAVLGLFALVFTFMSYKYKVTVLSRGGSGKEGAHFITKIKRDRAKLVKTKGITKWKLLFARKTMPPVSFDNIYPGNNIFLYQSADNVYHPFKLQVSNPSAEFEAIPSDVSFWMGLELQQVAQDYAKQDFWTRYGNVAVMMGTILFCLILVGVTVYYTYQHANGVTTALGGLSNSLRNVNTIAGIG